MNRIITYCFYFIFVYIFLPQTSQAIQNNNLPALTQPRSAQSQLAQSRLAQSRLAQQSQKNQSEDFDELGQYTVPSYTSSAKRFGFRVFGGFNFASNIKSRYNDTFTSRFPSSNTSTEYILPHTSLLGSLSIGGSAFFLFTKDIGVMFTASYEIESKVEQYKYNPNLSYGGRPGVGCYPSSKDPNYLLCQLSEQFWYSIISLELSGYYQILSSLYIFAGPNFFIPIGFKSQPIATGRQFSTIPPTIKGGIGGQIGVGGIYRSFFIEVLFKTQNLTLEGIRFDSAGAGGRFEGGILETGRLWGLMIRGGFQF